MESGLDLNDVLRCLALETVDEDLVEGRNLPLDHGRVFGGQILGQVICAAAAATPDKAVKSLTVLFPREGDTSAPMRYRLQRHQAGRTFASTGVVASQGEGDRVIAAALVSLHAAEEGPAQQTPAPTVGPPEEAVARDLGMVPWETRIVGDVDLGARTAGPPTFDLWMRAPELPDAHFVHQALLAHATDLTLIGTALRPFADLSQADAHVTLQTAVTSHSLWFHRIFRLDEWLLVSQHSPVAHRRRFDGATCSPLTASWSPPSPRNP
ncbi:MAG: acyl-CoA thioesterase domain-containing protein [Acidimicrobiales bacterium]